MDKKDTISLFKFLRNNYTIEKIQDILELYEINIPQHKYKRIYKKVDSSGYLDAPSNWGVFIAIRRAAMQVAMKEDVPAKLLTQTFGITMRSIRLIKSRNAFL